MSIRSVHYVLAVLVAGMLLTAPVGGAFGAFPNHAETVNDQHQDSANSTGEEIIVATESSVTGTPGETITFTVTITNTGESASAGLVEFTEIPEGAELTDVSGDVSQNLSGSSPPGVITSELAPNESTSVSATYALNQTAVSGTTTVKATFTGETTISGTTAIDINVEQPDVITPSNEELTITPGNSETVELQINNTATVESSILFEFTNLPENVTVAGVSGNISQDLLASSPPGVITTAVSPGDATRTEVQLRLSENATGTENVTVQATIEDGSSDGTTVSGSTTIQITAGTSLEKRFGGNDGKVDNVDVLQATNAANRGEEVGGEPVTNLDVLQLVNRLTQ